ncbi:MAG: hypothetical protein ACKVOE_09070 [Rickettsiales bacterium]
MSDAYLHKKFHLDRLAEVRGRYYQAILDDQSSLVANSPAETRAVWQPICDDVLDHSFALYDTFGEAKRDDVRHYCRHAMNAMMHEGLCDDFEQAAKELQRLLIHAQSAVSEIHADPHQRELLQGVKPQPGEQRRVNGRFGKKFKPEDTSLEPFTDMLVHARHNVPAAAAWNQSFTSGMRPFWDKNAATMGFSYITKDNQLPVLPAIRYHVYEALAERYSLPVLNLPVDHTAKLIQNSMASRNLDHTKLVEILHKTGKWEQAVETTLLQLAEDDMRSFGAGQFTAIWNAGSDGQMGIAGISIPQRVAICKAAAEHAQKLIPTLLEVAESEITDPVQLRECTEQIYRLCRLAPYEVHKFMGLGAGRQSGARQ